MQKLLIAGIGKSRQASHPWWPTNHTSYIWKQRPGTRTPAGTAGTTHRLWDALQFPDTRAFRTALCRCPQGLRQLCLWSPWKSIPAAPCFWSGRQSAATGIWQSACIWVRGPCCNWPGLSIWSASFCGVLTHTWVWQWFSESDASLWGGLTRSTASLWQWSDQSDASFRWGSQPGPNLWGPVIISLWQRRIWEQSGQWSISSIRGWRRVWEPAAAALTFWRCVQS